MESIPELGVVFWPVGTGDSTTVVIDADTVLQVDLHDMVKADEDTNPETAVVDRLVEVLPIHDQVPYLAAFVLTHADKDHCAGFRDFLDVVTIGELWATPRLWREFDEADGESLCDDAKAFHEEVLRRVEATKKAVDSGNAPLSGDRVLIVGYDADGGSYSYHDLPDEFITGPGHTVTSIDGTDHAGVFEAFIHAPFSDDAAKARNETSLAMQVTLTHSSGADAKFLLFGDLAYDTIVKIFNYTSSHDDRDQYMEWDVLLAPHHCSKKVMYVPDGDGGEAFQQDVMDQLDSYGRAGRTVVSSSGVTPLKDEPGANPPHRMARDRYEEIADPFVCTMEWPTDEAPAPVAFAVDETGLTLIDPQNSIDLANESVSKAAAHGRLAAVVAGAGLAAIAAGRQTRARREVQGVGDVANGRGIESVRRAISNDPGRQSSTRAPSRLRPVSGTPEELAERQLRRLAAVSAGAIQIISGPAPVWQKGWFDFDVSLDLVGSPTEPGGIDLRDRERFLVRVGPHYPFVAPVVETRHLRWAGTPHVQWGRRICLYLAPALEWAPEDGMRGLIDRLLDWLSHAAAASLDPVGQPPHPPVAYAENADRVAIIHANIAELAPRVDADDAEPVTLLGWGSGSDDRLDVDAWFTPATFTELDDAKALPVTAGQSRASVCFLLNRPIAFEYPSDIAGLATGLQRAGVTREAFQQTVRQAIVATAARMPAPKDARPGPKQPLPSVAVFIGSPSRSKDGKEVRTHLVGFDLDLLTPDLDTVLESIEPSPQKVATPIAAEVKLPWLVVYEDRSEVTQRRDQNSAMAHLRDRRVLILGAGALGAPIAEACVRAGATMTVVDNGRVTPGILVRQPYYDSDIGHLKASVLAERLNRIGRRANAADAITDDAISACFTTPQVPDFDLVIDATANAGVRAAIERARAANRDAWPPVVTMLVDHVATLGLLTVSAPGASGAGHDVLRRSGIAAREPGSAVPDVAEEFFPHPPRTAVFQPEPGCSEPTFTGSAADLGALANSMLLAAVDAALARPRQSAPMTAIAVRSPLAARDDAAARPGMVRLTWANDRVEAELSGEFEVRLSQGALNDIRSEARRRSRMHPELVETGGMLIGTVDEGVGCIFIDRACPPTPDSLLGQYHFEHGTEGAQETVDHLRKASADANGFVGMWHTHPQGAARPSRTDEAGMSSLIVPVDGMSRALMLIVAGEGTRWASWRDGDGRPALYLRLISGTSTTGSVDQPRPPGEYFLARSIGDDQAADRARRFRRWMSILARVGRRRTT